MSKITILLSICAVFLVVCHGDHHTERVCSDGGCPDNDLSSSSSSAKQLLKKESDGFLLLGGYDDDDGPKTLDNVEAYGSNLSLPSLPSLPLPLLTPIAEMTLSGAIYVAGGQTSDGRYNDKTFLLSSLSSSKWKELEARIPIPVYYASSVVVGDIVLLLVGWSASHNNFSDAIQMLNTNKSLPTWELLKQSKLPESLWWHSAALYEGQVIIVTGFGVTYTTPVSSIISDTKLDWVEGKLPGVDKEIVGGPSVEVVEGKLVAVYRRKVFTKTTMDSQWVQLKPLPQMKIQYPSIGSVRGNIVIAGGWDGNKTSTTLYNKASDTVFMWLEASSEWEEITSLKIPRDSHATVQLPRGIL